MWSIKDAGLWILFSKIRLLSRNISYDFNLNSLPNLESFSRQTAYLAYPFSLKKGFEVLRILLIYPKIKLKLKKRGISIYIRVGNKNFLCTGNMVKAIELLR